MKKIIAIVMLCGLVSNSCHAEPMESAGLLAGGVGIGVVLSIAGQFAYNNITGNNKKCTAAKDALAEIKPRYEGENLESSLDAVKADLLKLDQVCKAEYLDEECIKDKAVLESIVKKRLAELIDLEHVANRKKAANDLMPLLRQRYETEIELAARQGKIRKDQFVRLALENYGGTNSTPLSTSHANMNADVHSLLATRFEDLTPENQESFLTLKQILPPSYKYFGAECHEEIQKEQVDHRAAMYEQQMREQEYLLKNKEIEVKDIEKQHIANLDQRSAQLTKTAEQVARQHESNTSRIADILDRLEDQHGGIMRQNKNTKIAVDELKNILEEHIKNMKTRSDESARWMNEFTAWSLANSVQNNQQMNNQYNYQESPYAAQPSAPYQGQ